jgi:hypothetical protein
MHTIYVSYNFILIQSFAHSWNCNRLRFWRWVNQAPFPSRRGNKASSPHPDNSTDHHFYFVGPGNRGNNRDLHHRIQAWLPPADQIPRRAVSHHLGGIKGVCSPRLPSPQPFLTPSMGLQASRTAPANFSNLPLPFIVAEHNTFIIHP